MSPFAPPERPEEPIADLVDFYRRWPDLRSEARAMADGTALAPEQREVLDWMIRVVDRVGPADLVEDKDNAE